MENLDVKLDDLALSFTTGIGAVTLRSLVSNLGSAQAVLNASVKELKRIPGIGEKTAFAIKNNQTSAFERAEKEVAFASKHGIEILTPSDKKFPWRLKECYDAPSILYYRGNADLNAKRIVSIVGSRKATHYGKSICNELVEALTDYDVLVVSGLAYGIDSYAHKASIDNKIPTIGVLGHGLDRIYPDINRSLARTMLENGGILSEFPSKTQPDRQNFPKRNRIIAGMTDVVIVVEAAIRGGALITAEIANNYNRDVCAFPGNINNEYSKGCNFLIKSHRAHLISRAKDLEYLMNWDAIDSKPNSKQLELELELSSNEKKVYDYIKINQPVGIDQLAIKIKVAQSKMTLILLELEMKGLLVALPGKIFKTTT